MNTTQNRVSLIESALPYCLVESQLPFGKRYQGKVRDTYDLGDKLVLITTDRQSAFDRHIATIPFKGQVLNETSAWWFHQTASIIPNHLISVPDPNVMIAKKCRVFPIEVVVRGYITGTTNTSLWTRYQQGLREISGLQLPEGLQKNSVLAQPIITPTTKDALHDEAITAEEIIARNIMTQKEWEIISQAALRLYAFGKKQALASGLILVDTKYEFGRDGNGEIILVDELHTQDSSRYWSASTYQAKMAKGLEPDSFDKEFLRLWFREHCDPYEDKVLPKAPLDLITKLAANYIQSYEMLTSNTFQYHAQHHSIMDRINANLCNWLE